MRNFTLLLLTFFSIVLLSACSATPAEVVNINESIDQAETETLTTTTQKTGKIEKIGENYYLTEQSGAKLVIDSYSINLDNHLDQTVTLEGQYSGDTLFVGKIQ